MDFVNVAHLDLGGDMARMGRAPHPAGRSVERRSPATPAREWPLLQVMTQPNMSEL